MCGNTVRNLHLDHNSAIALQTFCVRSVKDGVFTSFSPHEFFFSNVGDTIIMFHNNIILAKANPDDKTELIVAQKVIILLKLSAAMCKLCSL